METEQEAVLRHMSKEMELRNYSKSSIRTYEMQLYKPDYFADFDPVKEFEKWAAIEVSDFDQIPKEMGTFLLSGGLYAVFDYKGLSNDSRIFQYIFGTWLTNSGYLLDNRPPLLPSHRYIVFLC